MGTFFEPQPHVWREQLKRTSERQKGRRCIASQIHSAGCRVLVTTADIPRTTNMAKKHHLIAVHFYLTTTTDNKLVANKHAKSSWILA